MMRWILKTLGLNIISSSLETSKLDGETLIVTDLETTGLNIKNDYILEAAIFPVRDRKLLISDTEYFKMQSPVYNPESARVHGILQSEAEIPEKEGLLRLTAAINSRWLIGHHVRFDYEMIKYRCRNHQIQFCPKGLIDTQLMAVKLDHGTAQFNGISVKDYTLHALCRRFYIHLEDEHTAAGDSFATALLFLLLLARFREKKILLPVVRIFND